MIEKFITAVDLPDRVPLSGDSFYVTIPEEHTCLTFLGYEDGRMYFETEVKTRTSPYSQNLPGTKTIRLIILLEGDHVLPSYEYLALLPDGKFLYRITEELK